MLTIAQDTSSDEPLAASSTSNVGDGGWHLDCLGVPTHARLQEGYVGLRLVEHSLDRPNGKLEAQYSWDAAAHQKAQCLTMV